MTAITGNISLAPNGASRDFPALVAPMNVVSIQAGGRDVCRRDIKRAQRDSPPVNMSADGRDRRGVILSAASADRRAERVNEVVGQRMVGLGASP